MFSNFPVLYATGDINPVFIVALRHETGNFRKF